MNSKGSNVAKVTKGVGWRFLGGVGMIVLNLDYPATGGL